MPDRVIVFANVLVYLRREAQGTESREANCDAMLDLEVTRLPKMKARATIRGGFRC